ENFYGFTKLECEKLLEWFSRVHDINFAALRYFNAAGYSKGKMMEKNAGNLLPIVMEVASERRPILEIYGDDYDTLDGTGVRDYIHVLDIADAHVKAIDYVISGENNLIVNLSTGKGHSVMEIVYLARELLNHDIDCTVAPRRLGDPGTVVASNQLARNILDWEPKNSDINNIILSMWEVYKK
ncbi:MAG TPA: NAD-dependent epimerase/dehydratase family protein, partial [Allocoleopsis sp.]